MDGPQCRRVGGVIACGDVVVDPGQVHRIFAEAGDIVVRCRPGVCEFHFGDAVVRAYSEVISGEFQEELVFMCGDHGVDVWRYDHFRVERRPGVAEFSAYQYHLDDVARDDLVKEDRFLGAVKLLPAELSRRLGKLPPEAERMLVDWLAPNIAAACPDLVVLRDRLRFPAEQYETLYRLLNAVGTLDAGASEYGGHICNWVAGLCAVEESRGREHVELRTYCPDPDLARRHVCSFILRL